MKKILSVFLSALMLLSVMVIAPVSVSALGTNTFDVSDYENTETFRISTADDMMAFADAVTSGKNFENKTVTLENDIDLQGKTWVGIGNNRLNTNTSSEYWKDFAGTFDGNYYTISNMNPVTGNYDRFGCLFNSLVGEAVVKNFTLEGTFTMTKTASGNSSFYGSVAARVGKTDGYSEKGVLIQNVHSSVVFDGSHLEDVSPTNCGLHYVGGLVGYMNSGEKAKLTIDNCIYDGSIVCNASAGGGNRPYYFGGLVAFTGHRNAEADRYLIIRNSVYAGDISLVSGNHVGAILGGISDYCNDSNAETKNYVQISDCIAMGTVSCSGSSANYNGELIGAFGKRYKQRDLEDVAPVGKSSLSLTNVYYVDVAVSDSKFGSVDEDAELIENNVQKVTKEEILALDATDFTAGSFACKNANELNSFYPCPAGLVPANGWIASLTVGGDAKVLGAAIRCTDAADTYSGLRFVSMFNNSTAGIANGGAADANFGIILISKAKYDAAVDKASVAGLVAAGGVQVKATKVDTSVDGYTKVSAVIYNIQSANYEDEVVAVSYVNDTLVGASDCESIYTVAVKCVEQNDDTPAALAFAQQIKNAVESN